MPTTTTASTPSTARDTPAGARCSRVRPGRYGGTSEGRLTGRALAQGYGQTWKVESDEGRPVANMRLPGEIVGEIPALKGITYVGPAEAETTLYEFFDYNCPYCRKAAADMVSLAGSDPTLRIGLINNPILSPQSAQAAKVALAVPKSGKPTRVRFETKDGKKVRVAVKSGEAING